MKKLTGTHLWTEMSYRNRKYDAASGTILDLVSVFKETNRNFKYMYHFLMNKRAKSFKTILACKKSTDLIL
jgi:hypothetical protein